MPPNSKPVCGSPLRKKPGKFCQISHGLYPNGRCKLHGGRSLSGIASPRYKTGLYSKYVPKTLRKDYDAISEDRDLTELRDDLALQTTLIMAAFRRMDETEAPPWGKVVELLNDCVLAQRKKNQEKFEAAFVSMAEMIRTGHAAAQSMERLKVEVRDLIQEKTRTASAEWKRQADLQGLVELSKVMMMQRAILEANMAEIVDPLPLAQQLKKNIMAAILRFMPPPSRETAIIDGRDVIVEASGK
jgi:hypothetical protein